MAAVPSIPLPEPVLPAVVDSVFADGGDLGLTSGRVEGASHMRAAEAGNSDIIAVPLERNAVPLPENAKPEYPLAMARRFIEADFIVYFVVDSTGMVDKESIQVPPAVHELFASAVRRVIVRWHFFPAEKMGQRVRQFIGQPFRFKMVREGESVRVGN